MKALDHWNRQCKDSDIDDKIRVRTGCQHRSEVVSRMTLVGPGIRNRITCKQHDLGLVSTNSKTQRVTYKEEYKEPCHSDTNHNVRSQAKLRNRKDTAVEEQDSNLNKSKSSSKDEFTGKK